MPSGNDAGKWLECNGQAVDPNIYPKLAILMGNTPNYQGVFLRGYGSQSYSQVNGSIMGRTETVYSSESLGVIQGDAIRNITGTVGGDDYSNPWTGAFYRYSYRSPGWDNGTDGSITGFDASRIVPTSNENRPVNRAVLFLIKAK